MSLIGVYIHVPFCRTRCPYCDFNRVSLPGPPPEAYLQALLAELDAFDAGRRADSVYLGGGTPSLLTGGQLERIFDAVSRRFELADPEISIEANPDDVTQTLTDDWRALGVNRVSLGVQSFDDLSLQYLGRRHDAAAARRACEMVAERFDNWSMDLIYGAHPAHAWEATLAECAAFTPPHVSCYGLTYEAGTPFEARTAEALDEDRALACFRASETHLKAHTRYEVSNFALSGRECRHNVHYWRNEEYVGFGPGAYSFIDGVRSVNSPCVEAYMKRPLHKAESLRLTEGEIAIETLIQHFRLRAGVRRATYAARFGRDMFCDFGPVLDELIRRGLLEESSGCVRPTPLGFELNNEIGLALVD